MRSPSPDDLAPMHRVDDHMLSWTGLAAAILAATLAAPTVGCGGDDEIARCRADEWETTLSTDCHSARELAERDAVGLVVTQDELDWSLDVYRRGYLPLTRFLGSPPITSTWSTGNVVITHAERFTTPWLAGNVTTGVAVVDDVLARAHVDTVVPLGMMRGPYFELQSSTHAIVGHNVAAALANVADLEVSSARLPALEGVGFSDAFIERAPELGDAVDIVYRRGWGDCFVSCTGQVSWRVRVTPASSELVSSWNWGEPPSPERLESWQQPNPDR